MKMTKIKSMVRLFVLAALGFQSAMAANWDDYTYHVVFNDNGGSGGSGWSGWTSLDMPLPPSVSCPTRTGYTFSGYYVDGAQVYYSNGNLNSAYKSVRALCAAYNPCYLKAYWQANTYTVTLNWQGGAGGSASVTATYDAAMPKVTVPTRAVREFLGYFDAPTGGAKYYNADGTSAKAWDKDSAATLYAQWRYAIWTELKGSTSGKTLDSGYYFISANTTFSNATTGGSGLSIADGATVYIYVPADVTLTATGAAGSGMTGGGAGIHLPKTSTLNLIGSGTVVATGGKAAMGENGADGANSYYSNWVMQLGSGKGGNGGGGAGAGIGTAGGTGGAGGASVGFSQYHDARTEYNGKDGQVGSAGFSAADAGRLFVSPTVDISGVKGGDAAQPNTHESAYGATQKVQWYNPTSAVNENYCLGRSAGGGNGGSGCAGNAIGAGGAGGGGGGSGGSAGGSWAQDSISGQGSGRYFYLNGGRGGNGTSASGSTTAGSAAWKSSNPESMTSSYHGGKGGTGMGAGETKPGQSAQVATSPEYGIVFYKTDMSVLDTATYAVGSATTITLPACETGYAWKNIVYGKPCGEPSDLSSASDAKLTDTINARNVYGDLAFKVVANTYTVTLNANGGTGGSPSVTATYGAAMPSATMPTKAGYKFLGYFDAQTDGVKYYNADGTSAANWDKTVNTTLYAQWAAEGSPDNPWSAGGETVVSTNGTGGVTVGGTGAATSVPATFDRKSVTSATIGEGVTEIGARFFKDFRKMKRIEGGAGLVRFGEKAFYRCLDLEEINIANKDFDMSSLENAVVYQMAINAKGEFYMVPKVTVAGYTEMLCGKKDLSDAKWEELGPVGEKQMTDYGDYRFFKVALKKIGE